MEMLAKELLKLAKTISAVDHAKEIEVVKKSLEYTFDNAKSYLREEYFNSDRLVRMMKEAINSIKKLQRLEQRRVDKTDPVADAKAAYGDSFDLPTRKLMWKGKYLPASETASLIKEVLADGYNEFDADNVARLIKHFSGTWALAREGSVAVYTVGTFTKEELIAMASMFRRQGKADEAHGHFKGKSFWIPINLAEIKDEEEQWAKIPDPVKCEVRFWWD